MSDEDQEIRDAALICWPALWGAPGAKDSTPDVCADCGQDVWVAPTGREIIADNDAAILCIPCGMASIRANPETEIAPPTPRQLQEIRKATLQPPV